ncbi:nucleotidyltransferase domain-containing protein [Halobacillus litoralis]|uniref:nucleotidyltransferase domain-containing protein n=1 Tax=Halobacillus litoralis TaxID=45668 RepID=UPI001CFEEEBC|nr:nucleotidyltransferase domain-containing protein [Halobacillus litoralis]
MIDKAMDAARRIVDVKYSECDAALLAGSVIRGEATTTSDLDLIVFYSDIPDSYRESFYKFGWPVEAFVHNWNSYGKFFQKDCEAGHPSMPRMISEGRTIKENERLKPVRNEANLLLQKGPESWSKSLIDQKRYFLTDTLDDFIGCSDRGESLLIAGELAERAGEFYLRINGQWSGSSKWMIRALRTFDDGFSKRFIDSFDLFYKNGDKEAVILLIKDLLAPYGGPMFEGFSVGRD